MAAENSGVPGSATSSWNSAGRSERAMSTSAAGSLGERTILVAMAVSFVCSRGRCRAGGRRPAAPGGAHRCGLPELLHVLGKVRRERIRLDRAVGVEAHGQVLAGGGRGAPLSVEPAPGLVTVVDPDLVGLAEQREQSRLVRDVGLDLRGLRRGKLAADLKPGAPRQGE